MMLLSLLACDPFPELGDSDAPAPVVAASSGDCSGDIYVPTGLLGDQLVPADHDAEVYGEDPTPFAVHLGLPSRNPAYTRSFLWRTDTDTLASSVMIGPKDGFPDNATVYVGGSFLYGGSEVGQGEYREHEVRICVGLTPGVEYSYRVGGPGGWSTTYSFSTPLPPGTFDNFRIAFFGDSRSDMDTWGQVAAAIDAQAPDLMIASGDMVATGSSQTEWDAWFAASGDLFARRPLIAAHGNHEFLAQSYFAQLGLPGNEEWFAVDFGDTVTLTLNDTVRDAEDITYEQVRFLESELAATAATWKFANHHQPIYSTCTTHGSDEELRQAWGPVFDAGDLDMDIAGHNHIYERSVPITGDAEVPGGVTYLVTGGAGAPLYEDSEADWFGAIANPVNHYVIGDVSALGIDLVVYDLSGNVIDSFTLTK